VRGSCRFPEWKRDEKKERKKLKSNNCLLKLTKTQIETTLTFFQGKRFGSFIQGFRALHLCPESLFEARRPGRDGLRSPDQVLRGGLAVPQVQREDDRIAGTSQKHLQNLLLQSKTELRSD
jgi:hypothetical protein